MLGGGTNRGPIKEHSEDWLEHRRPAVRLELTVFNMALHPRHFTIKIGDRCERAILKLGTADVDSHLPAWIIESLDANPIAVLPVTVGMAEVPSLQFCQSVHKIPCPPPNKDSTELS